MTVDNIPFIISMLLKVIPDIIIQFLFGIFAQNT